MEKCRTSILAGPVLPILIVIVALSACSSEGEDGSPSSPTVSEPSLNTHEVTAITSSTAQCGGTVSSDGGGEVVFRGICWSLAVEPTISDFYTHSGIGVGSFASGMTELLANTTYFVRAFATNSFGTGYGSTLSFTTNPSLNLPTLTTQIVTAISSTTAECGGTITDDGGSGVTDRGVCWSESPTPTISDDCTIDGAGGGVFSSVMEGLSPGSLYFVRAYATNNDGTAYGITMSFTTDVASMTVIDIDGNIYQTVKIGNQWWMAENLKVTHYQNGNTIPRVIDDTQWTNLSTGGYCFYNNDIGNESTYGALYNWFAASDVRNIAPEGWRVPTEEDWQELEAFLGDSPSDRGGKLKEAGTAHWESPNYGATNESGFTALPGGIRGQNGGYFQLIQREANFWSSTEHYSGRGYGRGLGYSSDMLNLRSSYEGHGFSLRCIKN